MAKLMDFELKLIACDYTQYLVEGYYFDAVDVHRLREEYLGERKVALEALAEPLPSTRRRRQPARSRAARPRASPTASG